MIMWYTQYLNRPPFNQHFFINRLASTHRVQTPTKVSINADVRSYPVSQTCIQQICVCKSNDDRTTPWFIHETHCMYKVHKVVVNQA